MPISENIKMLREAHSMSQAEFGAIAGVSDKAVSTWEKGIKAPRMGAIQRIADYFGIQKSYILDDGNKQPMLTKEEMLLLRYYRAADSIHKTFAMEILKEHPQKEKVPAVRCEDFP